jgi:hypothetical protein
VPVRRDNHNPDLSGGDLPLSNRLAGPCRGPNGACSALGVVNDGQVDLTCRTAMPSNPSLDGVITFHGNLAPDGVLRGKCSHSRAPGLAGQASLMPI